MSKPVGGGMFGVPSTGAPTGLFGADKGIIGATTTTSAPGLSLFGAGSAAPTTGGFNFPA